jgi:hypothetical protein
MVNDKPHKQLNNPFPNSSKANNARENWALESDHVMLKYPLKIEISMDDNRQHQKICPKWKMS